MPRTPEEQATIARFSRTYSLGQLEVMRSIERCVCGCDYGGTSWTTRDEADRVISLLNLGPGQRLLEVGTGAGWPGLYFAKRTGCDVALTDLPFEGLQIARARAAADGLTGAYWIAAADGTALPFRDGFFDAVYHSDVLCCLLDKPGLLRACRSVLRRGGKMVFSVIFIPPDLDRTDHVLASLARTVGPPFVEAPQPYETLLRAEGWAVSSWIDVTPDYLETMRTFLLQLDVQAKQLAQIHTEEEVEQMRTRRRGCVGAIEGGALRRALIVAVADRPDR